MRRRFPLEGLLRARALAEELAAADLARANAHRDEAAVAVGVARTRLSALDFRDGAAPAEALAGTARSWAAVVSARSAMQMRVRDLESVLGAADAAAATAADDWSVARSSAAMIDRLRERHAREVTAEDLRTEQIALDEAALRGAREEDER